jgi:hypothetical protein
VLGVAAAAAVSSAAIATPCVQAPPTRHLPTGVACALNDKAAYGAVDTPLHPAETSFSTIAPPAAADIPGPTDPTFDVSQAFTESSFGSDDPVGAETFSAEHIKITNLQATMTANTYVAGVETFAPAAQNGATEDLKMYGPDYLSTKWLPAQRHRARRVGVGLVTTPSHAEKKSDAAAKEKNARQSVP